MQTSATDRLYMRSRRTTTSLELAARYGAAYMSTLLALAAAQLSIENELVLLLTLITLLGLPLSLWLRKQRLYLGSYRIPRPLLNSMVMLLTLAISAYALVAALPNLLSPEFSQSFWLHYSAGQMVTLLMKVFLIFAACRCLAIINDKDAVLCAVPSFSVLLLMIPIHKGPEVVVYFLLWAIVCAVLFALDHRGEMRRGASGYFPSILPGQEAWMSARGLASVMGFSMVCAIAVSYLLSGRDPEERSRAEGWVTSLASRLTHFALDLPDVSVNAGPERQIDFTTGPSLPTNAPLWQMRAISLESGRILRPQYWRMFTLSRYDGTMWSQMPGNGFEVPRERLDLNRWPITANYLRTTNGGGFGVPGFGRIPGAGDRPREFSRGPTGAPDNNAPFNNNSRDNNTRDNNNERSSSTDTPDTRNRPPGFRAPGTTTGFNNSTEPASDDRVTINVDGNEMRIRAVRPGYDIAAHGDQGEAALKNFGSRRQRVRQEVSALVSNTGFLPVLPAPRALLLSESDPNSVKVREDQSVDMGVLRSGQVARVLSEVASGMEYGVRGLQPPQTLKNKPNPEAQISAAEKAIYLQLPETLPLRVRNWSRAIVAQAADGESDYSRALRLSRAVQRSATYTLRPPGLPEGRDATDFFLFQSRRGYCTYFAGALVVTCRTVGIPARVVSGFTNPQWQRDGSALFREANAHAWTEVWVPNWGWATLDATPPDLRGDNAPTWIENWGDLFASTFAGTMTWFSEHRLLAAIFILAALAFTFWILVRGQRRDLVNRWLRGHFSRRSGIDDDIARRLIFQFYNRIARKVARRFRRRTIGETPTEWLEAAEMSLERHDLTPLRHLTALYTRAKYSPLPIESRDLEAARSAWNSFSWKTKPETASSSRQEAVGT